MNDQKAGSAVFGLDVEKMVREAWRVFQTRPLTLLGVSCLVQILWIPTHLFGITAFFWLPFTLCVPYATVHLLRNEPTDRVFLGWLDLYPRVIVVFMPVALAFLWFLSEAYFPSMTGLGLGLLTRKFLGFFWASLFFPLLVEAILAYVFGLAALLCVRKKLSPVEAILELFTTPRHAIEAFLVGSALALFGLSGMVVCCFGVLLTTTFAWICLGVAYFQIFEE